MEINLEKIDETIIRIDQAILSVIDHPHFRYYYGTFLILWTLFWVVI
jgi:hypothetical protein